MNPHSLYRPIRTQVEKNYFIIIQYMSMFFQKYIGLVFTPNQVTYQTNTFTLIQVEACCSRGSNLHLTVIRRRVNFGLFGVTVQENSREWFRFTNFWVVRPSHYHCVTLLIQN